MPEQVKPGEEWTNAGLSEGFAVIQTGTVTDDGEIVKYDDPVVIGVYADRAKANSMKKRHANRVGRIVKWFAEAKAIPTPLLAVRIVMLPEAKARKPKASKGEPPADLSPEQLTLPPVEPEAKKLVDDAPTAFNTGKKKK